MTEYLNSALSQIKRSGIREFTRLAGTVEGCMFLTLGEPDFNTPDIIKEQAKADLEAGRAEYEQGVADYDAAAAEANEKLDAAEQELACLLYTSGTDRSR